MNGHLPRAGARTAAAALTSGLLVAACGPNHHLAEYDFRDTTLAVVAVPAPSMEFFSDLDLRMDPSDLVGTVIRVGTEIAREVTLNDFRPRADSAAANVNVPARTAERTLEGVTRYMRARPVPSGSRPDYELELRLETWGFVADGWNAQVYLNLEGDLLLLDGTGRIVWSAEVTATNPLNSTDVRVNNSSVGNVVTALALANLSRQEIEREMEVLADISADALVERFGRDLDEAREEG